MKHKLLLIVLAALALLAAAAVPVVAWACNGCG